MNPAHDDTDRSDGRDAVAREGAHAEVAAEAAYREAIEAGDRDAWNGLGQLLAKQLGREEEAEAAYREAIEANNKYARRNLGLLLGMLGRSEEAIVVYDELIASLQDELGYEVENCDRTSGERWRCDYALDALSGPAGRLRVQQRGDRCWSAATQEARAMDRRIEEGCISAWQFFKAM